MLNLLISIYQTLNNMIDKIKRTFVFKGNLFKEIENNKIINKQKQVMQKVILEKPENQVHLEDLNHKSLIGVIWKGNNTKSFIYKNEALLYHFIGKNNIMKINQVITEPSVQSLINRCKKDIQEVYLFENHKELFKWLAED